MSDNYKHSRYVEPTAPEPSAPADKADAELWRALIGSARIRPIGCAGIRRIEPGNYAHLGLELWTVFGSTLNDEQRERLQKDNALGREWLTAYAIIAKAAQDAAIDRMRSEDGKGGKL